MRNYRTGALVGAVCGLLGTVAGLYLGARGALSQTDAGDVGIALGAIGAIAGTGFALMGCVWNRLSKENRL